MESTQQAAEAVAEAVDAWLKDPRDATAYRLLVEATERWRAHARPLLSLELDQGELEPDDDVPVTMPGTLADGIRDLTERWAR